MTQDRPDPQGDAELIARLRHSASHLPHTWWARRALLIEAADRLEALSTSPAQGDAELLMREFYVSRFYDPKAARNADTVKAAIAFVLDRLSASPIAEQTEALRTALERIARYDVGLQGLIEDEKDTPENVAKYYAGQVERRRKIARAALAATTTPQRDALDARTVRLVIAEGDWSAAVRQLELTMSGADGCETVLDAVKAIVALAPQEGPS